MNKMVFTRNNSCCAFFRVFLLAGATVRAVRESHEDGEQTALDSRPPVHMAFTETEASDDLYTGERHVVDDETSMADVPINLAERSPRFEDPSGHANVTVQLGGTAFLNCRVLDLQDKTVMRSRFAWFCLFWVFDLFRLVSRSRWPYV